MAFFNRLPNIEYDLKPVVFPFSEKEYALVKNFFRRYKLSESSYNYAVLFTEYTMTDEDRLDNLSQKTYGNPEYDWIIMITNNIINSYFDLPIKESDLYEMVDIAYNNSPGDPSISAPDRIHHYETIETFNSTGDLVLKGGLKVERSFYTTPYKYYDNGEVVAVAGNTISVPISNYEYEKTLNDERRKIYLLRPEYIQSFIIQYEEGMKYSRSSSYIDSKTKRSGI
jgi:hypothetical protein